MRQALIKYIVKVLINEVKIVNTGHIFAQKLKINHVALIYYC